MIFSNRNIAILLAVTALTTVSTSCFKEEPLNAECDIEKAWLHVDDVESTFYTPNDTLIEVISTEDKITFTMRGEADITALAPQFTITQGATITPASGSVHDFSQGPVTYTVTSQDGKWSRTYTVECNRVSHYITSEINYNFEHFELNSTNSYYIWHNTLPDGSLGDDWASGNGGYKVAMGNSKPEDYPTSFLENGFEGYGVVLTTRSTGFWGRMKKMPIAAGNLYLGKFDISMTLTDQMKATLFGIPFTAKPKKLSGYYQYTPGATFVNKNLEELKDRIDAGDIYSVLYLNHDSRGNSLVLYGNNVLSSDQIVAIARVQNVNETNGEWVHFDVEYQYLKEFDYNIMQQRGYNFTVVFSSSIEGATFEGAIGSTLKIDKVKVTCENKE